MSIVLYIKICNYFVGVLNSYKNKIYGCMDCPTANATLRRQYGDVYVRYRLFFKDEATAIAVGFRPVGTA